MKSTYLVIYRPGPAWIPGKPVTEQPLKEHGKYMARQSQSMTVTGKLTDEGVECQAMRDDEGKLYTLTGDKRILEGFRTGDRVKVTGHIAEASFCMQGATIVVKKIERAK